MADINTVEARIKRLEDQLKDARKDRTKAKTTQKRKDAKAQNKKDILYAIYRRSLYEDEYKRDISSSDFNHFLTRNYDRAFFGLPPLTIEVTETQSVTEERSQTENEQAKIEEEHIEPESETPTDTEVENKSPEDEPETSAIVDLPWKMVEGQMRLYIKSEYRDRDKIVRTAESVFGEESRGTHFDFDKARRQWYFIKTETDYDLTPFSDWPLVTDEDE